MTPTAFTRPGRPGRPGRPAVAVTLALALSACASGLERRPAPESGLLDLNAARPYAIAEVGLRDWGDALSAVKADEIVADRVAHLRDAFADEIAAGRPIELSFLALSGGGPDGAYGAGLLAGWTARGDRPNFNAVTGVSTGAIIALFAFLGSDYDQTLRSVYTSYRTSDLAEEQIVTGLLGGRSLFDTSGYRALIERYVTDDVVALIGMEYRRGRLLLIGTTNLDAARPVVWNVGAIAASGHPQARRLIIDIVQASSAIPVAFPPVVIPVEIGGESFDELHVDGGATEQVLLFNPGLEFGRIDAQIPVPVRRTVYVVVNNALRKRYDPAGTSALDVGGSAVSSLIGGSGSGDVYKIYAVARRDGLDFALTSIPPAFAVESDELFDPAYMTALYEFGYRAGAGEVGWLPHPVGFVPDR